MVRCVGIILIKFAFRRGARALAVAPNSPTPRREPLAVSGLLQQTKTPTGDQQVPNPKKFFNLTARTCSQSVLILCSGEGKDSFLRPHADKRVVGDQQITVQIQ